jgi:hypothetical protein
MFIATCYNNFATDAAMSQLVNPNCWNFAPPVPLSKQGKVPCPVIVDKYGVVS